MSIIITAQNAKGADLLVNTSVEPTTVKEAVEMLAGIKSGITLTTGKRNRVHGFVIIDSASGREITFERDKNGMPVQISDVSPVIKSTNTNKNEVVKMNSKPNAPKVARRLKMQRDVYTNASGKRIEVVITAAKGGGKIYEIRTVVPEIKDALKGGIIRAGSDTTREITGHELVNVLMPYYDGMGYRFTSRERVAA